MTPCAGGVVITRTTSAYFGVIEMQKTMTLCMVSAYRDRTNDNPLRVSAMSKRMQRRALPPTPLFIEDTGPREKARGVALPVSRFAEDIEIVDSSPEADKKRTVRLDLQLRVDAGRAGARRGRWTQFCRRAATAEILGPKQAEARAQRTSPGATHVSSPEGRVVVNTSTTLRFRCGILRGSRCSELRGGLDNRLVRGGRILKGLSQVRGLHFQPAAFAVSHTAEVYRTRTACT